nr:hypothetical protein [Tanacetum cinerariifolium]
GCYKESFENPSNQIAVSNPNEEKEEPSQESDFHQLIEECNTEVSKKQNMEDTMFKLVKICQEKEFICIHDDVDDLIESALNSKLLLINSNSQRLDKKEQEVKMSDTSQISSIHAIAHILSTKEPEHLLSMGYEHLSITPEMKSDKVTESNAENLLPILSKCEVTLEDEIECDVPDKDNCSPAFTTFLNPLFNNDDLDFSNDESLSNEEDGDTQWEEIDIVTETDDMLALNVENDDDSSNNSLLEEVDLFLSDNSIPPGIENFADDQEGDIRFLEELLIDDSILSHESPNSNFKDNLNSPQ